MIAAQELRFHRSRPGLAGMVRMSIDPVVAIGVLFLSTVWFDVPFDRQYVILALLVFSMTFPGSSGQGSTANPIELNRNIIVHWLTIIGALVLLGWASRTLEAFDQRVILGWVIATPVALVAAHSLIPLLLARVLAADGVQRTAVIVGANEMGQRLAEQIRVSPFLGVRVVGYFDDRDPERLSGIEPHLLLGSLARLADYVRGHDIDVIYSALPMCPQPRILELLDTLRDTTASIYFVPDLLLFDLIQARIDTVGSIPAIAVCESPYYGLNALVKRTSDLVLATLVLVVATPVLLAIAVGVKLSSPGPVLFKQRRNGLDGREIVVYKFRTMSCLEDGDVITQATRDDPRTTRFGAFLRQYSLDELPQFVNVIQGRMSVVGPRPHAVAHNRSYRKLIRGYMIRHKIRPGITGFAQVRGMRGETETVEKMRERIACDLEYLRNWSLSLDLKIVLKTIIVVVLQRDRAW